MAAHRIPEPCRTKIRQAITDAKSIGPVAYTATVVDLACNTDNYWWTGATLTNRECHLAMALIESSFARIDL